MNKMKSHIIAFFFDLICFAVIVFGYQAFIGTVDEIRGRMDVIQFNSRIGFFVVGLGFPLIHLFGIADHFWSSLFKQYSRIVNLGFIVLIIVLFVTGVTSSSWLESQVKNADYIYCRNVSGVSALAKNRVYTRDMEICEELIAAKHGRK